MEDDDDLEVEPAKGLILCFPTRHLLQLQDDVQGSGLDSTEVGVSWKGDVVQGCAVRGFAWARRRTASNQRV